MRLGRNKSTTITELGWLFDHGPVAVGSSSGGGVSESGNLTPVSCSDSCHNRSAITTSRACVDRPTSVGWPLSLRPSVGADIAAAGQVLRGGVQRRQRALSSLWAKTRLPSAISRSITGLPERPCRLVAA